MVLIMAQSIDVENTAPARKTKKVTTLSEDYIATVTLLIG